MIRLAVRVRRADAELVLADLLELAPSGVEERDLGEDIEYAVYGAPGELPDLPDLRAAAGDALVGVRTEEIADDWSERWREFHRPVVIGGRVRVRPPWEAPGPEAVDVEVDPAQAFGTGAHPTTRLCLELLLELSPRGAFLDLGCGSGVLAIAAAKLGWAPMLAVDVDPLSVQATRDNAARNRVSLTAEPFDLRTGPPPSAEVMAANLLRPLLLDLAARLHAAPRVLLASGLLVDEADEIAAAFAPHGLRERDRRELAGWAALRLQRG